MKTMVKQIKGVMKKIILLTFTALIMVGCNSGNTETEAVPGYRISIIEIDSCEYVISHVNGGQVIIHKQNCRYCKERRQQENKALKEE